MAKTGAERNKDYLDRLRSKAEAYDALVVGLRFAVLAVPVETMKPAVERALTEAERMAAGQRGE